MSEKLTVNIPAGLCDKLLSHCFDDKEDDIDDAKLDKFVGDAINHKLHGDCDRITDAIIAIYERFMAADRLGVVMQPDGDAARLATDVIAYINAVEKRR